MRIIKYVIILLLLLLDIIQVVCRGVNCQYFRFYPIEIWVLVCCGKKNSCELHNSLTRINTRFRLERLRRGFYNTARVHEHYDVELALFDTSLVYLFL